MAIGDEKAFIIDHLSMPKCSTRKGRASNRLAESVSKNHMETLMSSSAVMSSRAGFLMNGEFLAAYRRKHSRIKRVWSVPCRIERTAATAAKISEARLLSLLVVSATPPAFSASLGLNKLAYSLEPKLKQN